MSESGVYNSSIPQPKGAKTLKAPTKSAQISAVVPVSSLASDFSNLDIGVKKPQVKGKGKVKSVISGDTIVVKGGAGKEKRVGISGIVAPRAGNKKDADEPFGYQAREFLRSKLQDQIVEFVLHDSTAAGGREFADVFLGKDDVAHIMVAAGYAKVALPKAKETKKEETKDAKPKATKKEEFDISTLHPEKQALYKLQKEAEAKKLGMFSGATPAVRTMNWEPDTAALFAKHKGKALKGFVDRVLDGSTYKIEIADPEGSLNHSVFTLSVAGALAPRTGAGKDGKEDQSAAEAQAFAEARLLNRNVTVVLQGMDKTGNVYGTLTMPQGNIAVRLIETGNAKYVPWTAALTSPQEQAALKNAHDVASKLKVGVYAQGAVDVKAKTEYEATVVQVLSGDAFVVRDQYNKEHRLALASVQTPRLRLAKPEPYAFEAREFLRKSLIGKRVRVVVEYERDVKKDGKDGKEEDVEVRQYVTAFKNKYNVAVELVNAGLAEVLSYSKDADRTIFYSDLCQAEAAAKAAEKGKWSKKTAPLPVMDLTNIAFVGKKSDAKDKAEVKSANRANSERAQIALKKIENNQVHAVLDQVFSPTRIKAYVPVLHAFISVGLSGVSAPAQTPKGEPRNPIVEAGIAHLKKYLQQDMVIEVNALGRNDTFLGNVFHKESRENMAVSLLKEGFATTLGFSADRNKFKSQLYAAESEAKKARRGVWVDYDEEKERLEQEKARQEAAEALGMGIYSKDGHQYIKVVVTDVADPIHFYINNVDDKNVALVKEHMTAFVPTAVAEDYVAKKGDLVAAKFDADGTWNRARVDSYNPKTGSYTIQYIDFGNIDQVAKDNVRPLTGDITKVQPLARPATLAGVKAPLASSEHFETGANALAEMTADTVFEARIEHTEYGTNGVLHLTLFHESDKLPINAHMLKQGWVRIHPRPLRKLESLVAEFEEYELEAKDKHYGIWEYGAYTSDVDE